MKKVIGCCILGWPFALVLGFAIYLEPVVVGGIVLSFIVLAANTIAAMRLILSD
jgi:hypothetical protein